MSIFSSLFDYRPRPNRRPLEDFLSEALVDLLGRLSIADQSSFVSDVLLKGEVAAQAWQACLQKWPAARFRWETQRGVKGGRVDILLVIDGHPCVIVENKIGALVRRHEPVEELEDLDPTRSVVAVDGNQMQTYGRWLVQAASGSSWPACLVMLTHFSKEPDDFRSGPYGVANVAICRWRDVWLWARRVAADPINNENHANQLVREFAEFLEEKSMSSDYATLQDLAKAQIFTESATRIENLFTLIDESVESVRKPFEQSVGRIRSLGYFSEPAAIWSWFYLAKPRQVRNSWHVGWGIRFPTDQEDWWVNCKPATPAVPHAFVTAMTEGKQPDISVSEIKEGELHDGWSRDAEGGILIIGKPLHEFGHDPAAMAEEMAAWISTEVVNVTPVLMRLAKAFE